MAACSVCALPQCGCDLSGEAWCNAAEHCYDVCENWHDVCASPPPPLPAIPPFPPGQAPLSPPPQQFTLTHYWDCSGQGCDAGTLDPWAPELYWSSPAYAPQNPDDHGGPSEHGESLWLFGAASDTLALYLGPHRPGSGADDTMPGGCGLCVLIEVPTALDAGRKAIVMAKNRCPYPGNEACAPGKYHMDVAVPGFDTFDYGEPAPRANHGYERESRAERHPRK